METWVIIWGWLHAHPQVVMCELLLFASVLIYLIVDIARELKTWQ